MERVAIAVFLSLVLVGACVAQGATQPAQPTVPSHEQVLPVIPPKKNVKHRRLGPEDVSFSEPVGTVNGVVTTAHSHGVNCRRGLKTNTCEVYGDWTHITVPCETVPKAWTATLRPGNQPLTPEEKTELQEWLKATYEWADNNCR